VSSLPIISVIVISSASAGAASAGASCAGLFSAAGLAGAPQAQRASIMNAAKNSAISFLVFIFSYLQELFFCFHTLLFEAQYRKYPL
jgi:hypothetical protein